MRKKVFPVLRLFDEVILGLLCVAMLSLSVVPVVGQKPGGHGPPPPPAPPPPARAPTDSFDQNRLRYPTKDAAASPKSREEDSCFLPPLNGVHSPTVAITNLQIPAKARKEYEEACVALKDKKATTAESHLRKAVQQYPKYPAAWVTLGQMLAARQQTAEARHACFQASAADSSYLPSYLCLADIAVRGQDWDEVLKLSSRALELDPTSDAVAYGYNAVANLNLHRLSEAEKSALKASEIDKNNSDPRVHFLLAQIYEAKGDPANEAAQLREYLKFASDPSDAAMVKQYLADLEKRTAK